MTVRSVGAPRQAIELLLSPVNNRQLANLCGALDENLVKAKTREAAKAEKRKAAASDIGEEGLHVALQRTAGRRIAHVTDGRAAL